MLHVWAFFPASSHRFGLCHAPLSNVARHAIELRFSILLKFLEKLTAFGWI